MQSRRRLGAEGGVARRGPEFSIHPRSHVCCLCGSEGDLRMNVEKWKRRVTRVPPKKKRLFVGYILFSHFLVLYTKTANFATPPIAANFDLVWVVKKKKRKRKKKKEKERKRKKKKEKRRFSQRWMWRINISFFTTFGVFCWLDLKFKGCFVFKYFSPRRNYVLNIPNCSISHDFFWGSRTFSFYGSLVHKNLNFLWPQEFWELPKGCHSLLE